MHKVNWSESCLFCMQGEAVEGGACSWCEQERAHACVRAKRETQANARSRAHAPGMQACAHKHTEREVIRACVVHSCFHTGKGVHASAHTYAPSLPPLLHKRLLQHATCRCKAATSPKKFQNAFSQAGSQFSSQKRLQTSTKLT